MAKVQRRPGYLDRVSARSGSSEVVPAVRVVSWDFKDSPPFDAIEQCVNELLLEGAREIRLAEADTASDDFGLVISDRRLTRSQLADAWQHYLDSFEST